MMAPGSRRYSRLSLFACGTLAAALMIFAPGASAASPETFKVAGGYTFIVPVGVDQISVVAVGGEGGECGGAAVGGKGARVSGTVPVVPLTRLTVTVAGEGVSCDTMGTSLGDAGGFGGGGTGGEGGDGVYGVAGGGGASSIAPSGMSGPEIARALIVAAGGGGATDEAKGGNEGAAGANPTSEAYGAKGGDAGTPTGGGAGGSGPDSGNTVGATAGGTGKLGEGGNGGHAATENEAIGGGGGGGGYYGGGGGGGSAVGGFAGGGGGGSSYLAPGATEMSAAVPSEEAPFVTITYTVSPPPTLTHASLTRHRFSRGHGTTFHFTLSERATVSVKLTKRAAGRVKGHACVAPTKALEHSHSRKCSRTVNIGTVKAVEPAGSDTLKFNGKIRGRAIKPGSYSASITANNFAGETHPVGLRFTVVG